MTDRDEFTPEELHERVIYALLRGVARATRVTGLPSKTLGHLVELAYFHELKAAGRSVKAIGARLGVSPRRAAQLSKALRQAFMSAERAHTLPRRVEFVLWAEPLGVGRIRQALGGDVTVAQVRAALAELTSQGRVRRIDGRTPTFAVTRGDSRMPRDTWLARIDALDHLVGTVADAVTARFFRGEPRAFARTVSLRVRAEDRAALRALYEDVVWPELVRLDAAAADDPNADPINLALLWAPRDYVDTLDREEDDS